MKFARRGVAAVEFACVVPVLLMVIIGLFEVGRGLMVKHLMTMAAKQGCRAAVIEGKSNTDVTTAVVNSLSPVGISSDTVTVQVNDLTANASTAQAGDEITVIVSVPVSSVTWVPVQKFLTGTISGQYTLQRE